MICASAVLGMATRYLRPPGAHSERPLPRRQADPQCQVVRHRFSMHDHAAATDEMVSDMLGLALDRRMEATAA